MGRKRMTFTDRFDLVATAFEQSGRSRLQADEEFGDQETILERYNSGKSGMSYEELKKTIPDIIERIEECNAIWDKSPLVRSGKVKVKVSPPEIRKNRWAMEAFAKKPLTLDDEIWTHLQKSAALEKQKLYSLSSKAAELVNKAKIDTSGVLKIENGNFFVSELDISGIYDCPDGELIPGIKAVMITVTSVIKSNNIRQLNNELRFFRKGNELGEYEEIDIPDSEYDELANSIIEWIHKLYLIRRSEKTPLGTSETEIGDSLQVSWKSRTSTKTKKTSSVIHSYVDLSPEYRNRIREYNKGASGPLNKDGKSLIPTAVSGFVRIQHYGPQNSLTKTIWIDGFTRGQWVSDDPRHVTVKA